MVDDNKDNRVVSLSPKSMVDSKADWPLHRVIEFLQRQEQEDKANTADMECRVYHNATMRMFLTVVDVLADYYGVTKGKMCRWLSYHGDVIAKEDRVLSELTILFKKSRLDAVAKGSSALAEIQDNLIPYTPKDILGKRTAMYVHSSWVLSDFDKYAAVCGVASLQVAQVYMTHSILTSDLPEIAGAIPVLSVELSWWDRWMKYRASALGLLASVWESSE